jgi:hypothetical protein
MTETSTAENTAWWVAGALALVGIAALVLLTVALVRDGGISRIPPPLVSSQPTLAPVPTPEPVPAPAPAPAPATPPR